MLDAKELPAIVEDRLDAALRVSRMQERAASSYSSWKARIKAVDDAYHGMTQVRWPDMPEQSDSLHIPNYVQLALEDRARSASSVRPVVRCDPVGLKPKDKANAEKRERIAKGYLHQSGVWGLLKPWATDAGGTGISVCKVMPDYSSPLATRFPTFCREDPRFVLPGPAYAQGPFLDDCIISYDIPARDLIARYPEAADRIRAGVADAKRRLLSDSESLTCFEYYGPDEFVVGAMLKGTKNAKRGGIIPLLQEKNPLGRCPVVIGLRAPGEYHGDFDWLLPMMHTLNTMLTMSVDEGIRNTYAPRAYYDVVNPEDDGPDALLQYSSPAGKVDFIRPPGQPFSNYQLMQMLANNIRTGAAFSPSRSGDPNESVISAAGITAAQGQNNLIVAALQTDTIAPMLSAALELAYEWDEKACDTEKTIYGEAEGTIYAETYTPSKDIAGNYRNRVTYGVQAGMDPINLNVMAQQQWAGGNGVISQETAMEISPLVDNPQVESKRIQREQLLRATMAGIVARSSVPVEQGGIDPLQVAGMLKDLSDPETSLEDVVLEWLLPDQTAPLANPPGVSAGNSPAASGIAGAEEPAQPTAPPALADVLA